MKSHTSFFEQKLDKKSQEMLKDLDNRINKVAEDWARRVGYDEDTYEYEYSKSLLNSHKRVCEVVEYFRENTNDSFSGLKVLNSVFEKIDEYVKVMNSDKTDNDTRVGLATVTFNFFLSLSGLLSEYDEVREDSYADNPKLKEAFNEKSFTEGLAKLSCYGKFGFGLYGERSSMIKNVGHNDKAIEAKIASVVVRSDMIKEYEKADIRNIKDPHFESGFSNYEEQVEAIKEYERVVRDSKIILRAISTLGEPINYTDVIKTRRGRREREYVLATDGVILETGRKEIIDKEDKKSYEENIGLVISDYSFIRTRRSCEVRANSREDFDIQQMVINPFDSKLKDKDYLARILQSKSLDFFSSDKF